MEHQESKQKLDKHLHIRAQHAAAPLWGSQTYANLLEEERPREEKEVQTSQLPLNVVTWKAQAESIEWSRQPTGSREIETIIFILNHWVLGWFVIQWWLTNILRKKKSVHGSTSQIQEQTWSLWSPPPHTGMETAVVNWTWTTILDLETWDSRF